MATPPTIKNTIAQKEILTGDLAVEVNTKQKFNTEYLRPMLNAKDLDYKMPSACGTRLPSEQYWQKKPCQADEYDEQAGRFTKDNSVTNLKHFRELRECFRGRLYQYIEHATTKWRKLRGRADKLTKDEISSNLNHLHELQMAAHAMVRCANCYSRRSKRPSNFDIEGAISRANNQIKNYWVGRGETLPADFVPIPPYKSLHGAPGLHRSCQVEIINPKPRNRLPSIRHTALNNVTLRLWKTKYNEKMKTLRGTRRGPPSGVEKKQARNSADRLVDEQIRAERERIERERQLEEERIEREREEEARRLRQEEDRREREEERREREEERRQELQRIQNAKKRAILSFKAKLKNFKPNASIIENANTQKIRAGKLIYNRVKSTLNSANRAALPTYKQIRQENQTLFPGELSLFKLGQKIVHQSKALMTRKNKSTNKRND